LQRTASTRPRKPLQEITRWATSMTPLMLCISVWTRIVSDPESRLQTKDRNASDLPAFTGSDCEPSRLLALQRLRQLFAAHFAPGDLIPPEAEGPLGKSTGAITEVASRTLSPFIQWASMASLWSSEFLQALTFASYARSASGTM